MREGRQLVRIFPVRPDSVLKSLSGTEMVVEIETGGDAYCSGPARFAAYLPGLIGKSDLGRSIDTACGRSAKQAAPHHGTRFQGGTEI